MDNSIQTHVEGLNSVAELKDGIIDFCRELRRQVDSLNDALYSLSFFYQDDGYNVLCDKMHELESKLTEMEENGRNYSISLEQKIENIVKQLRVAAEQNNI